MINGHKIGVYFDPEEIDEETGKQIIYICDAKDPDWKDGDIPDQTPNWLYAIIEKIDPEIEEIVGCTFTTNCPEKFIQIADEK